MKTLLKNGRIINVFTGEIENKNILIEGNKIIGVGDYNDEDADMVENLNNDYVCPGFIDGHIHIESTMLLPSEFSKTVISHGTTAVVCDPHEIANVCGEKGIDYFLEATEGLPVTFYCMIPSCIPATKFDESFKPLLAKDIERYYKCERVLGLAEMMNYPGVIYKDKAVIEKLISAKKNNVVINGHAPLLVGKDLDKYLAFSINDDHESSSFDEAVEKLRKGQWVMVREGTAAKNLNALINLFDYPYSNRCLLVTDDKHPSDLLNYGHIDYIINQAIKCGKSPINAIQMATINAANCFKLSGVGAVAPGYVADILTFKNLNEIKIDRVFKGGKKIFEKKLLVEITNPKISKVLSSFVTNSVNIKDVNEKTFEIHSAKTKCRVIEIIPGSLLTNEKICQIDLSKNNGIDVERDILKIAVVERHKNTNHFGIGFVNGLGLKCGAIASTVSHDSHNIIVIGTNERDMACAVNSIKKLGGGLVVVKDGEIVSSMPLPIAGLMSDKPIMVVAKQNEDIRSAVKSLGVNNNIEPFMNMAFLSLSVIPNLKLTTLGLVDVNQQKLVPLFVD